jgi:hypothetical protein
MDTFIAYVLCSYDGIDEGIIDQSGFDTPLNIFKNIINSLSEHLKYGAFKLDISEGKLYYKHNNNPGNPAPFGEIRTFVFVIYEVVVPKDTKFDGFIDIMNFNDSDIIEIVSRSGNHIKAYKISYLEFINMPEITEFINS